MTNRWLLPDHIADVLPAQARHIEETRRLLLDMANSYGYELVMPPLVEHLDSLLIGSGAVTGGALDLQTFKLVDQHSGRSLGVRADTTAQVARIDAHLLNRQGLARLCYCGCVLHTRQANAHASREPLQFGAEIYGHAGQEADLEVMELLLRSLAVGGINDVVLDLSDVRIVKSLLAQNPISEGLQTDIYAALAAKDTPAIAAMSGLSETLRTSLLTVLSLYGGVSILERAQQALPPLPAITSALDGLQWLAQELMAQGIAPERIGFDLADLGEYGYYSGVRFAAYSAGAKHALARGGRYDNVGEVFGRKRAAVGFSLDIKVLVESMQAPAAKASIRMPWRADTSLRLVAQDLRDKGETVICVLPGHEAKVDEFACDRELIQIDGAWVVRDLIG